MTANDVRPEGTRRMDRSLVFGLLSIVFSMPVGVTGVVLIWLASTEVVHSSRYQSSGFERALFVFILGIGLVALIALILGVLGALAGFKHKSQPGCLLSAAGCGLTVVACLVCLLGLTLYIASYM